MRRKIGKMFVLWISGLVVSAMGLTVYGDALYVASVEDTYTKPDGFEGIYYGVTQITPNGRSPVVSGLLNWPMAMSFDNNDNLYIASNVGPDYTVIAPNGVLSTIAAQGGGPCVFDQSNNRYNDNNNGYSDALIQTTPSGQVTTVVASVPGGIGPEVIDQSGNIYALGGFSNNTSDFTSINKITPGGVVSTFATGLPNATAIAIDPGGNLYVTNCAAQGTINKINPGGIVSTFASGLTFPNAITCDGGGNVYVDDIINIDKITPSGAMSTYAYIGNQIMSMAMLPGKPAPPAPTAPVSNTTTIGSGSSATVTITSPTTSGTLDATFSNTSGGTLKVTQGVDAIPDLLNPNNAYGAAPLTFAVPADGSVVQIWELNFSGVSFTTAQLTFHFDPSGMTLAQEQTLEIYHYTDGQWFGLSGVVDTTADTITVTTNSFSPFALGLSPAPEPASLALLALAATPLLIRRRGRA